MNGFAFGSNEYGNFCGIIDTMIYLHTTTSYQIEMGLNHLICVVNDEDMSNFVVFTAPKPGEPAS